MSEAGTAVPHRSGAPPAARDGSVQNRIAELKVSGHLMTLDSGVFCVFPVPGSHLANDQTGLPGVRISLPPGPSGRPEAVSISTFREDGWMNGSDAAALIRVANGPAQILVTVYQAPSAAPDTAPRLQVMRLGLGPGAEGQAATPAPGAQASGVLASEDAEVVAHVQRTGDVAARIGEWAGERGSRQWIEGFSLHPQDDLKATDIEYQAVLGRGWLSPWIEGGKFCGSRGMALPLLGLKVRLKGSLARTYECSYSATFVDGSAVGPVAAGETCEAESLAALEAFQLQIRRRGGEPAPSGGRARTAQPAAKPAGRAAKPAGAGRRPR